MRSILRATAVLGASSLVTVGLSALRYKLLALQGGPSSIGVLGLLLAALALCTTIFGIGLSSSGVRYVAAEKDRGPERQAAARSALLQGVVLLGCLGGLLVAALSSWLAPLLFHDPAQRSLIWWLALAVSASVITGGQQAVLNGQRRLKELALTNVVGAVLGTALTLVALTWSEAAGLVAAFATPVGMTLLASTWFVALSPRSPPVSPAIRWHLLRSMVYLGAAFAGSVLFTSAVQLALRVFYQRQLGTQAVGYFQASWTIAGVYLGFVLNAMAAEYYPRISAISTSSQQLNIHIDRQIWVALLLAGPAILWMVVLAPIGIDLLYSREFAQAAGLLRLQLVGDILKVPAWALGFVLLAREAKWKFFVAESVANVLLIGLGIYLFRYFGLLSAGYAYIISYALYLLTVLYFVYSETTYRISAKNTGITLVFLMTLVAASAFANMRYFQMVFICLAFVATLLSAFLLFFGRGDGERILSTR